VQVPRLLQTASFRLTAFYGLLLVSCFILLLSISYWTLTSALRDQIKTKVEEDLHSLSIEANSDGSAAIVQDIADRLRLTGIPAGFYYLADTNGKKLAGNLDNVDTKPGWQEVPFSGTITTTLEGLDDQDHRLWGQGHILPDGGFLFVGQDAVRALTAQETILNSFAISAAITLLVAAVAGAMLSLRFLRRIDSINEASQKIMSGKLHERIQSHGTSDEIDRLSANLNELFDSNEALLESLKQMGTSIAHDLRSPLTRLRQGLEETRLKSVTTKQYKQAVDQAIDDTDHILSTFSALLRIAQVESGAQRSGFTLCDLSGLVEKVANTYVAVAEDGQKELSADIIPGISFLGDAHLLVQLFANLVENAINHTPVGTKISVALNIDQSQAQFVISDNGPGIPEEQRLRVFERFYRLDDSRSTIGNGLGLALVAAVAELHHITISLDDNKPGLRMTLLFP